MLRNYLIIAWRNLIRHKVFSLINILGLAIGMAACLLILQYVSFERSYDRFHEKASRIYRITFLGETGSGSEQDACAYNAAGPAMRTDFPEVVDYAHARLKDKCVIAFEEKQYQENKVAVASAHFLTLFSFPLVQGDPATALAQPRTVVISEMTARKYFGSSDPLGQVLRYDDGYHNGLLTVTGVMQDMPANSHLHLDVLISYSTAKTWEGWAYNWNGNNDYVYVLLDEKAQAWKVASQLPAFTRKYVKNKGEALQMQALTDIHLHSHKTYEAEPNGSAQVVYLLLSVGILILIIAWVNYVNLATARSVERAKEVGIRQVVGSSRGQLMKQFLLESLLINLLAVILAVTMVQLFLPFLNELTGKPLSQYPPDHLYWWGWIATFGLGALIAGLYPALVLSGFQPILVLKGRLVGSRRGVFLRKSLVIGQFAATVAIMVGTATVYNQLRFMQQQNLGMNIDQTLVLYAPHISGTDSLRTIHFNRFKQLTNQLATVQSVSVSECLPGNGMYELNSNSGDGIGRPGDTEQIQRRFFLFAIDTDFISTLGLQLIEGEGYSRERLGENRKKIVVNEAAIRLLGFDNAKEAIHQPIKWFGETREIAGIVANYHHHSLERDFDPMVYYWDEGYQNAGYLTIKMNAAQVHPDNLPQVITRVKKIFEQSFPQRPFNYFFLNERFNSQYRAAQQFGRIFGLFAGLAIFVACLGLFGLALFTAHQRTKEIGVRKVLGASVSNILLLLSGDFIRLVLLANLIAWPLAYWGVSQWLSTYAFRIDISPWLFVFPTLLVLLIALLTVSIQTLKAARQNPAKALRYE
jgi:putative ABC transport system permease protein